MARNVQLNTWGLNSVVTEVKLKIRLTEDVIDCAQRLEIKADARTERELSILTRLRDRTYDDIRYFINEREKKHWRLWDHYGGHMYKPIIDHGRMSLEQI